MLYKTELVVTTRFGSRVNPHTLSAILKSWGEVALQVEKLLLPEEDEFILWRLSYRLQEVGEEDESGTAQPLITGEVSLASKKTCSILVSAPEVSFGLYGVFIHKDRVMVVGGLDVVSSLVEALKKPILPEPEFLSNDEIRKRFIEACAKLGSYESLDDNLGLDPDGDPSGEPSLEEVLSSEESVAPVDEYFTSIVTAYIEAMNNIERDNLCNEILNQTDAIYGDVLKYGKRIYIDPESFGFSKKGLRRLLLAVGESKADIDDEKDFNTEQAEKSLYPEVARVEAITSRERLKSYLKR